MENPWLIFVEILIAAAILGYLFFRRRPSDRSTPDSVQRIETKLSRNEFEPNVLTVQYDRPAQLLIHRFDNDPDEELFEIEELQVYTLLPALHTTIIPFSPQRRGSFAMVLGGSRRAGTLTVE
jgi:hypothetical protein